MNDCEKCREYIQEADRRVGQQFMAAQNAEAHCIRTQYARLTTQKHLDEANAILWLLIGPGGADMPWEMEERIQRHLDASAESPDV